MANKLRDKAGRKRLQQPTLGEQKDWAVQKTPSPETFLVD